MKHIYIFCKSGVAVENGVGTYIRQLIDVLREHFQIQLNVVWLLSDRCGLEVIDKENVRYFYISFIQDGGLVEKEKVYAQKNVIYLLYPYLQVDEDCVFVFNYIEDSLFIQLLRTYIRKLVTFYVVHFVEYESCFSQKEIDLFQEMDYLIALSPFTVNLLVQQQIPPEKIYYIPNAEKDFCRHFTNEEKLLVRQKYFLSKQDKVLLFVGRVDLFKGIDFLLAAYKLLLEQRQDVHLFIVGDGLLDRYLPTCSPCWKHITFTGRLKKKVLADLYTIADLGIILSFQEQCSFVAIEMLMHGLPTIVSSVPGVDNMFEEGVTTFCKVDVKIKEGEMNQSDIQNIAKSIDKALNGSSLKQIGINARKCYEEFYQEEQWYRKYLTILGV